MTEHNEECPDCKTVSKTISKNTQRFITEMVAELQNKDVNPHMPASAFILHIVSECTAALNVAFTIEAEKILAREGESKAALKDQADERLHMIVRAMLAIIENHLPVTIASSNNVAKADISKVHDYIESLNTVPDGSTKH